MPTAAIYTRLSAKSKGQRNVVNLDTQEADCRQLASELDAVVVATFTEYGQSAFDRDNPDDRPAYAAMCDAMRAREFDIVIAWHTDRLWRDDLEKALFIRDAQKSGLRLVVTKTARIDPMNADDEFLLTILTAVAKKESADKRRRIKSKCAANAAAGKPSGGAYRPFGFESDKVTIRVEEAEVIREVCRRLLSGQTLRSVTAWMNSTEVRTVTGCMWSPNRVKDMATSPRNAGLRAVGRGVSATVVADAVWPAIVDRGTHDKLRVLLFDPARTKNRSARRYLLSGLLVCHRCNEKLLAHPITGRVDADGQPMRTYSCMLRSNTGACGRCAIQARDLEIKIGEMVVERFMDMAAGGAFRPKPDTVNDDISSEIATIDRKAARFAADFAADRITEAAYNAGMAGTVERRAQLSARVRRSVSTVSPFLVELATQPERLTDHWATPLFGFDRQRALITVFVDHIIIGENVTRSRGFDGNRVIKVKWKLPHA